MELRWDTISGHEKQKEALRTMLREGRLPHALLFTGPDGIGKRMVGRVLAAAILCDAEDGPCGHCESCRAMQLGSHPDYLEVVPEQNGKSAAQIRIEAIRSMQTQVSRYPVLAKRRTVLIDDADRMNEAAQNSLLKTLEEPEGPVTFILVTSTRSALLDTILSRCMPVAFGMLSPQEMRSVLLQHDVPEAEAADKLLARLKKRLDLPDADEARLTERLQAAFEAEGYHALFGKTQGYYGPYVWRETVPAVYQVELPDGSAEYTVNLLKGFVFRSWMDYLTFGRYGTGGWASPDGTINCIEQAYDLESERFRVSLLKHEAQHTVDRKRFPQITPAELEYRAKLVELHFSGDPRLLQKFLSEADESKPDDSHAVASARIGREFADTDQTVLSCIQTQALELLRAHTRELEEKYGESRDHPNGEAV